MAEGYGACLINKPELVSDMVKQTRNRVSDPEFTVSIKIRIHDDIRCVFVSQNLFSLIILNVLILHSLPSGNFLLSAKLNSIYRKQIKDSPNDAVFDGVEKSWKKKLQL